MPAVDLSDYKPLASIGDKTIRTRIKSLCESIRQAQEEIAPWEAVKKDATEELKPLVKKARLTKVKGDGFYFYRTVQTRKTLSKEKLLELGVSMDIIEQATEEKEVESLTVRGIE